MQSPLRDRWVFNKLTISERMGYRCGPAGSPITVAGKYCYRPIYNCAGNGLGGVLEWTAETTTDPDDGETIIGGITQPPFAAGYFWCEWFDGDQLWTDFTNDAPVLECYETSRTTRRIDYAYRTSNFAISVPSQLANLSTHLLIESIGGNIIEAAPRHMTDVVGRDVGATSYMEKYRVKPPWGNDGDAWWYWRQLQT